MLRRISASVALVAATLMAASRAPADLSLLSVQAVAPAQLAVPNLPMLQAVPGLSALPGLGAAGFYSNLTWSNADPALTLAPANVQRDGDTDGLSWSVRGRRGTNQAAVTVDLSTARAYNPVPWTRAKGGVGLFAYLNAGVDQGSVADAGLMAATGLDVVRPFVNLFDYTTGKHVWGEPGSTLSTGQVLPLAAPMDPHHAFRIALRTTAQGVVLRVLDVTTRALIWDSGEVRAGGFSADPARVTMGRTVSFAWGHFAMADLYRRGVALTGVRLADARLFDAHAGHYMPWDIKATQRRRLYPDRRIESWFSGRTLATVHLDAEDGETVSLGNLSPWFTPL